jgi:hypothetical protein
MEKILVAARKDESEAFVADETLDSAVHRCHGVSLS